MPLLFAFLSLECACGLFLVLFLNATIILCVGEVAALSKRKLYPLAGTQ